MRISLPLQRAMDQIGPIPEDLARLFADRIAAALAEAGRPDLVRQVHACPEGGNRDEWTVCLKSFRIPEVFDPEHILRGVPLPRLGRDEEALIEKACRVAGALP